MYLLGFKFHLRLQNSRIEKLYQSVLFLPLFEHSHVIRPITFVSSYVIPNVTIGHCGFSANILAARRSSAEAQAPTAVGGRLGQHVPLQRRGRQAGALHGGRVHGHGGAGELRAQVQGEGRATFVGNVYFFFFSLADPQVPTIMLIFLK